MSASTHTQPQVSSAQRLLTSYIHEGVKLDLYGTVDADGYEVLDVALAGSNVSLFELVPISLLERLSAWCNDKLPTGAELRRQSRDEARVEHAIWARAAA